MEAVEAPGEAAEAEAAGEAEMVAMEEAGEGDTVAVEAVEIMEITSVSTSAGAQALSRG